MISLALLPLTLQLPSLQRAVTVAGGSLLRQAAILSCSTLLATAHLSPALAATAATSAPPCALECFRECNVVAPGNKEYCSRQCDSYCAEVGEEAAGKVLPSRTPHERAFCQGWLHVWTERVRGA